MKITAFLLLFSVSFLCGGFTTTEEVTYDLSKKITIAEIDNGNLEVLIDTKAFLNTVNKEIQGKDSQLHKIGIKKGTSLGDEQREFFYIIMSSGEKNIHVVRLLHSRNGKVFMKTASGLRGFTSYDFFIGCEGNENCYPRMFYLDGKFTWSCREKPVCVSDEEAARNPCMSSTTLVD